MQATPILDKNGFIQPIVIKPVIPDQGGDPTPTLTIGLFEVVDYQSPYFGHVFKAQSGVFEYKHPHNLQTGMCLEINDMRHTEVFLFSQIKPVNKELKLIINYTDPIHGNRNYKFSKDELKRASYHYWKVYECNPSANFNPISYNESKTFKNHG